MECLALPSIEGVVVMEEIVVGVIGTSNAGVEEVLSTVFAARTHVPEEEAIDFKYVVASRNDVIYVCTHDISIKFGDLDILMSALHGDTQVQLFDNYKVSVYHLDA